jgi:hypothetical protein
MDCTTCTQDRIKKEKHRHAKYMKRREADTDFMGKRASMAVCSTLASSLLDISLLKIV